MGWLPQHKKSFFVHDTLLTMKRIYTKPMTDQELRSALEARDTIFFMGRAIKWQEVERQVERLGFGDSYIVSCTQGQHAAGSKISLKPEDQAVSMGAI
jgi:hypothetical protein